MLLVNDADDAEGDDGSGDREPAERRVRHKPPFNAPLYVALPLLLIVLAINAYLILKPRRDGEREWIDQVRRQSLLSSQQRLKYRQTYHDDTLFLAIPDVADDDVGMYTNTS